MGRFIFFPLSFFCFFRFGESRVSPRNRLEARIFPVHLLCAIWWISGRKFLPAIPLLMLSFTTKKILRWCMGHYAWTASAGHPPPEECHPRLQETYRVYSHLPLKGDAISSQDRSLQIGSKTIQRATRRCPPESFYLVRAQPGLRERFREGIIRSGRYLPRFKNIFRSYGLPMELTLLPHVEKRL